VGREGRLLDSHKGDIISQQRERKIGKKNAIKKRSSDLRSSLGGHDMYRELRGEITSREVVVKYTAIRSEDALNSP